MAIMLLQLVTGRLELTTSLVIGWLSIDPIEDYVRKKNGTSKFKLTRECGDFDTLVLYFFNSSFLTLNLRSAGLLLLPCPCSQPSNLLEQGYPSNHICFDTDELVNNLYTSKIKGVGIYMLTKKKRLN